VNARNRDALSAVVGRQHGRARMRAAVLAAGAAGLVTAGAVATTLPSRVTHPASGTSATGTSATGTTASGTSAAGTPATVHATSGGSGVAIAAGSSGTGSATAPVAGSGASHATSGGS